MSVATINSMQNLFDDKIARDIDISNHKSKWTLSKSKNEMVI